MKRGILALTECFSNWRRNSSGQEVGGKLIEEGNNLHNSTRFTVYAN